MEHHRLARELRDTLRGLNGIIASVDAEADRLGILPTDLRTPGGDWVLGPILAAKASCLRALADLGCEL